jgi:HD-GYP domain-containing protein (c-di-GMP phosphodiesterase class II)
MPVIQLLNQQNCNLESIREILRHRHLQTQMHCERAVLLADAFGKACALDPVEQEKLLYSAMFHDIGKIGIPDDILMHEDELDENQFAVMQMHSAMGETIVRLMKLEHGDDIARHIRHHHEHFDGSGYPDALAGDDIPLLTRMLTIVDCYDALRELRPYRKALEHEEAAAIMRSESGIIHDPELLERFLNLKDIATIGEEYSAKE